MCAPSCSGIEIVNIARVTTSGSSIAGWIFKSNYPVTAIYIELRSISSAKTIAQLGSLINVGSGDCIDCS